MNVATLERLISLNRRFYTDHGHDFSETRRRLQPGVLRLLDLLHGDETILDLGCGNGELARTLSRRGHRGRYVGLDFSLPLLTEARRQEIAFPAQFVRADLAELSMSNDALPVAGGWSIVTAFAVLHHLPGFDLRVALAKNIYALLCNGGLFMHSNWQFLSSPRLKARVQPWEGAGVAPDDVDSNDYLLDWKLGRRGLRYIHYFDEDELADMANAAGFQLLETFYSDGENRRLSVYQVWRKPT
ncbi:MAG TPA: class I SAM-dependent methyltransferase [Anaerolineales bacterium]|nr:class I SAM-dependent methyltransferase [Anaerolineales bacterium]